MANKKIKTYSLNKSSIERIRVLSEALNISESACLEIIIKIGCANVNDSVFKVVLENENR